MGSTPTASSYSDLARAKQHLTSPLCNSETESGVPVDPGADASGGQAGLPGVSLFLGLSRTHARYHGSLSGIQVSLSKQHSGDFLQ